MTKAEESALKAYPINEAWIGNQYGSLCDVNADKRKAYQEGYEAAISEEAVIWSEGDEEMIDSLIGNIQYLNNIAATDNATAKSKIDWLKSIRPQKREDLSELDKSKIWDALNKTYAVDFRDKLYNKIISSNPQKQWKPTEEQIKSLAWVVESGNTCQTAKLKELLEQLKEYSYEKETVLLHCSILQSREKRNS